MKGFLWVIISIFFLNSCVPVGSSSGGGTTYYSNKELKLEDFVYEKGIRTVQLYPYGGNINDVFAPASVPLTQEKPLTLEFDELSNQTKTYYAKIIHCNRDWTKSMLSDIQFCYDFNESMITTYAFATNTFTTYTHYKYTLPKVKLSGNYVIMIYRDGNQDDVILTKRFIVYENKLPISSDFHMSNVPNNRRTHQQLDFTITYNALSITMPQDIRAVIKKNNRWDNTTSLNPLYINVQDNLLDYRYFSGENNFLGGNEYRSFDIRSLISAGINIEKIQRGQGVPEVYIMQDKSRNFPAYNQFPDINGSFVINRKETNDGITDGEYANVHFNFKTKEPIEGNVFIVGAFNQYRMDKSSQLTLDSASNSYHIMLPFKQGYYNYLYAVKNKNNIDETLLEGSYYETENMYEILVYYRAPGTINDVILGYQVMRSYNR